jgi:hypothetical protein
LFDRRSPPSPMIRERPSYRELHRNKVEFKMEVSDLERST